MSELGIIHDVITGRIYRAVIDLGGGRVELTDFDEPDE